MAQIANVCFNQITFFTQGAEYSQNTEKKEKEEEEHIIRNIATFHTDSAQCKFGISYIRAAGGSHYWLGLGCVKYPTMNVISQQLVCRHRLRHEGKTEGKSRISPQVILRQTPSII